MSKRKKAGAKWFKTLGELSAWRAKEEGFETVEQQRSKFDADVQRAWDSFDELTKLFAKGIAAGPMVMPRLRRVEIQEQIDLLREGELVRIREAQEAEARALLRKEVSGYIHEGSLGPCAACDADFKVNLPCPVCEGTGRVAPWPETTPVNSGCIYCEASGYRNQEPCPRCGGTGLQVSHVRNGRWSTRCKRCEGSGMLRVECATCAGRGYVGAEKVLQALDNNPTLRSEAIRLLLETKRPRESVDLEANPVAELVAAAIKERGLSSRAELAALMEVDAQQLLRWERGRAPCPDSQLRKLAEFADVAPVHIVRSRPSGRNRPS